MAVFYKYEYTNKRKNIHPWIQKKPKIPQTIQKVNWISQLTFRISLRKGRGEQRVAKIYDSPCLPEVRAGSCDL